MTTPRFQRPKRGSKWAEAARALVIVTAEQVDTWDDLKTALAHQARWVGGLPADRTLRAWVNDAGLNLAAKDPKAAARSAAATEARLDLLADHRQTISDALAARAVPKAVELLVHRLNEQDDVERRVTDARLRLEEALVMQRAAADDDDTARQAARREVVLARILYAMERDDRIAIVDLMRVVTHGIARHLELEGLAQADDDEETNPLIVELLIPRSNPDDPTVVVIPQHQLPERT